MIFPSPSVNHIRFLFLLWLSLLDLIFWGNSLICNDYNTEQCIHVVVFINCNCRNVRAGPQVKMLKWCESKYNEYLWEPLFNVPKFDMLAALKVYAIILSQFFSLKWQPFILKGYWTCTQNCRKKLFLLSIQQGYYIVPYLWQTCGSATYSNLIGIANK